MGFNVHEVLTLQPPNELYDYGSVMMALARLAGESMPMSRSGLISAETARKIQFFWDRINTMGSEEVSEVPLKDRLVPLTAEQIDLLEKEGVFSLTGNHRPAITPISLRVNVGLSSSFCNLYDYRRFLTVWDLCPDPDGDPERPGMHLVAIRRHGPMGWMTEERPEPWAIGWVTEDEFSDLYYGSTTQNQP